ncbi:TIGR04222 domain-containing membrane protein [Streptomyces sp. PSKA54]|uniref:TIGR04222 domain-containing membrane protein n=1 Tax=Streptomyces himalayensis subsp. aureolus TaxID=2758039 RepID=A0A7W2D4M5_9ACTN|nr:TIGR04222 domain-containing membrane protein [Streptomyces himalayensis]MBA4864665.1 TIGR04222 domain-containing membrane protein [Streptomyces himalayensis subsp. aureolus]
MRMVFRRSAAVVDETQALDAYDVAFLAGGAKRVADCAVIALSERGLLRLRSSRMRAVGDEIPRHPVERAMIASCPRSRSVDDVHAALQRSPEVEEIGHRLAEQGLVTGSRRRLTRAGRRRLQAAERDANLPAYVLGGPTVLPEGPVRRSVANTQPIPSGLGRALIRMGKALDRDSDSTSDSDSGSGGGFSCGGGGGGD